jgi:hypothetical protein
VWLEMPIDEGKQLHIEWLLFHAAFLVRFGTVSELRMR